MTENPAPIPGHVASDLLRELRNATLKFCQTESAPLCERLKNAIVRERDRTLDSKTRSDLDQVYKALNGRESALNAALLVSWPIELDRAIGSDTPPPLLDEFAQTRSQLSIVEDEDVQREIQFFRFIAELEPLCAETASSLTLRICHLRNLETVAVKFNPFRPETFVIGLVSSWEDLEGSRSLTHRLLSAFKASEFLPLNALYAGLNKILIARGVMPKERYIVRKKGPPAGAAGLWVKSDVARPDMESDEDPAAHSPFSAARFMQQLTTLSQHLADSALHEGHSGAPAPSPVAGASAAGTPQPSPALLAAMDALLAQMQPRALASGAQAGADAHAEVAALGLQDLETMRKVSEETAAPASGVGPDLNRETIEMVATIFDFIVDDASIPLQLKVLIADLQLPVLKDALTNSDFFLDDSQPARHVIDLLARCGVFWEFLPGNEVADTVREQVVRLREASREGRDGFPEAAASLTRFLADLEARYEARLQSSLANVTAQERRAEAMPEVDRSLDEWFSAGPIEETLANFLRGPWRSVLCEYVVERADQPEACDTAFAQTSLLIWSVLPKTGPVEREHLLKQLPGLLQLLNAGLDRIHYGKDEREPFLKFLMARHAQVIRPAPANPAPPPIPIPKLAPPDQTEPVATVKRWNAQQLALGDWLTLEQPPGKIRRYRLSWISPKRTKFVLTARESSEALALNDGEVEAWLRSGALKLVDSAPIVQRAISASFESR